MLFSNAKLDHLAVMDCQLNVAKADRLKRSSDVLDRIADKAGAAAFRLMDIPICHLDLLDQIYTPLS